MQKASCPCLAIRARLAHGPALFLPQRSGREQGAAEQHGQTDRPRGFVYLCPQGTGSPSLAPSRDLTLRCFWEVGNGHLVLQRGAGGLPSPHTADTGPVSPARLHWGADLAARTWHVLSIPRIPPHLRNSTDTFAKPLLLCQAVAVASLARVTSAALHPPSPAGLVADPGFFSLFSDRAVIAKPSQGVSPQLQRTAWLSCHRHPTLALEGPGWREEGVNQVPLVQGAG